MDPSNWPLLLIEGVLVFGGAIAFGWWQLRDVERDRRAAAQRRESPRDSAAVAGAPAAAEASRSETGMSPKIDR